MLVQTDSGVMRSVRAALVVGGVAAASLVAVGGQAQAGFTDCNAGTFGGSGRACLWTLSGFTSLPSVQFAGNQSGLSISSQSHGNRTSNRCVTWFNTSGALITHDAHDTGKSWSTRNVGSLNFSPTC